MTLPCGQCIGCRVAKAQAWAIRCVHEAKMHHPETCHFTTATYDDDNYTPSLNYKDIQTWLKALRKRTGPFRFYAAGEYGELHGRAHWHILFFGLKAKERHRWSDDLYEIPDMTRTWHRGQVLSGEVTYSSARYTAKYVIGKRTGPVAEGHYLRIDRRDGSFVRVEPEHAHMSRRPGLGDAWIRKYYNDVYRARDGIVQQGGHIHRPPSYYDRILGEVDPELRDDIEIVRMLDAEQRADEYTPERLRAKEQVALAKEKKR